MELTSLQLKTTQRILDLYNSEEKVVCEFKSPTGSGKSLMASYFISALIERNVNDKFIFVIATPSSSSLPLFFEQKLNKYKVDLPFSKFEVEYIQSPSSAKTDKTEAIKKILAEQNKVYIFGKASFGKGRILSEYGIIDDFINSAMDNGYKLIYIRDEAHIGGETRDNGEQAQNFENLMTGKATFVLKMTATPNWKDTTTKKVILKEKDLNSQFLNDGKFLLKTTPVPLLDRNLEDKNILSDAISKFKKIKADYAGLNIGIRPAMLIQVDNNTPTDKDKARLFSEGLANIKDTLNTANLSWVQYFGNNDKDSNRVYKGNFTLDDITQNNNEIDVIIFKIGPATGWDIPRACMLVQLRNVSSSNLNTQTLGRIKRNPYPNLERNDTTDCYYIYSNTHDEDNDLKSYHYKIPEKWHNETFLSINIDNKKKLNDTKPQKHFEKLFKEFLETNAQFIGQDLDEYFRNNGREYKKIISTTNGKHIYTLITNPFIFLRDYQRLIGNNKAIYDKINIITETFGKDKKWHKEFVMTILLEKYKNDIIKILNQAREFKPCYKIVEQRYDPKIYTDMFGDIEYEEKVSKRNYLFDIDSDDVNRKNRQPLDSRPEDIVFSKIYDFADEYDNIKLWAKNQTTSNIFGEYLDDFNVIRHSYFDFVIKFNNGIYLYIEVKGIQDINDDKTRLLETAYSDYFENMKKTLFMSKLVISVWRVDSQSGMIYSNCFYDKREIKQDLNTLSVDNLLKTLSELSDNL